MPFEPEPTAEMSPVVEQSPLEAFGSDGADDFPPTFEDSFPFAFPMLLLLLLLLKTCVTLSMTLPLMMIPILEAALRDDEAAEAAAEWAEEGGAALGADPLTAATLGAAVAAAAASFPLSLSASAAAAAADSGEGRELGCFEGGAAGAAGLLRLNPSEVILREISFEARSTTPGVLVVVVGVALLLVTGALLEEPVLLLPPLDEVVEPGLPLFIVLSGPPVKFPSAAGGG